MSLFCRTGKACGCQTGKKLSPVQQTFVLCENEMGKLGPVNLVTQGATRSSCVSQRGSKVLAD
jgi:hypothetical protein